MKSWSFATCIALSLVGMATMNPSMGQDEEPTKFKDWFARCETRELFPPCDMIQTLVDKESKARVLQFSVSYEGTADRYGVQVIVPLGVLLPAGAVVDVDGSSNTVLKELSYNRCEHNGCYLEGLFDEQSFDPLKKGIAANVTLYDMNGASISLPVSLSGFSAALDYVKLQNQTWANGRKNSGG